MCDSLESHFQNYSKLVNLSIIILMSVLEFTDTHEKSNTSWTVQTKNSQNDNAKTSQFLKNCRTLLINSLKFFFHTIFEFYSFLRWFLILQENVDHTYFVPLSKTYKMRPTTLKNITNCKVIRKILLRYLRFF